MKRRPIQKSLAGLIGGRMRENNLTAADIERDVMMSASTINRRLRDPDKLTLGELRRICRRLDISLEEAKPYLF